jgi:hypothetical protein
MRRNTQTYCLLCILLILWFSCATLQAATQGDIGQTSSSGSISIRLHIPESTRLIAQKSASENQYDAHICLHVVDSVARSKLNYYRIARVNNNSALQDEEALAASIKKSQLMQLRNFYGENAGEQGTCRQQQISLTQLHQDGAETVLLMLIAE